MRKKSPPYPIIAAVVFAAVAVFAFLQYSNQQKTKQQQAEDALRQSMQKQIDDIKAAAAAQQKIVVTETNPDMRKVLYAKQPIEPGMKISSTFFEMKLTPNDILKGAYTETDQYDIIGYYAVRHIEMGDPLTPINISKTLPFLSQRISTGMRAIALPVFNTDSVNGTGGFAVDGDNVDLLLSYPDPNDPVNGKADRVILQNLKILYMPGSTMRNDQTIGLQPSPTPGGTISVVFEVTPEEASMLSMLQATDKVQFRMILRGINDREVIRPKTYDSTDTLEALNKIQSTADQSMLRVKQLASEIALKEKNQGQTNAPLSNPTP